MSNCPSTAGIPARWQSHPAALAARRRHAIMTRKVVADIVYYPVSLLLDRKSIPIESCHSTSLFCEGTVEMSKRNVRLLASSEGEEIVSIDWFHCVFFL